MDLGLAFEIHTSIVTIHTYLLFNSVTHQPQETVLSAKQAFRSVAGLHDGSFNFVTLIFESEKIGIINISL